MVVHSVDESFSVLLLVWKSMFIELEKVPLFCCYLEMVVHSVWRIFLWFIVSRKWFFLLLLLLLLLVGNGCS